jgi:sugar O-acyltransferase (sialic acid O-acetyltransferase NeuD family)
VSALPKEWVIFGSGIVGRQVFASLQAHVAPRGERILGFLDDDASRVGQIVADLPILGAPEAWLSAHGRPVQVAMAVGDPKARRAAVARVKALEVGALFTPVVNPFGFIGPNVRLGEGVVMQAGVVCQCDLEIGPFTYVGSCCSVAHDCVVGEFNWLSPGVRMAGYAAIGNECWVGMNTVVLPHKKIHDRAETGAGSVITRDVPEGETVAGVPAKPTRLLRAQREAQAGVDSPPPTN